MNYSIFVTAMGHVRDGAVSSVYRHLGGTIFNLMHGVSVAAHQELSLLSRVRMLEYRQVFCTGTGQHEFQGIGLFWFWCVYKRRSKATGKRITYEEKLGTDGVLGLNGHPLSFSRQLFDKNKAENSVLLCLAKTRGYSAGYIVFGFPLRRLGMDKPWVPLLIDKGSYEVPLINIKYGEQMILSHRLSEGSFDLILDGSLRFSYFTNEIFVPFVSVAEGLVCLAIRSSDDIQQPGTNILGGMAMKEHMIMLDEMTKRFWWMEDEDCNERRLGELI